MSAPKPSNSKRKHHSENSSEKSIIALRQWADSLSGTQEEKDTLYQELFVLFGYAKKPPDLSQFADKIKPKPTDTSSSYSGMPKRRKMSDEEIALGEKILEHMDAGKPYGHLLDELQQVQRQRKRRRVWNWFVRRYQAVMYWFSKRG